MLWRDPNLLLGQACGDPLVSDPTIDLRVVAVPTYNVPDCPPGQHYSRLFACLHGQLSDYTGKPAALNSHASNIGSNLFRATIAPLAKDGRFFGEVIETGSHRSSVEAVRLGCANIGAVDAVSHAAIARFEPEAVANLHMLGKTANSPALPFVTSARTAPEVIANLRAALHEVSVDPALAKVRETLFLRDIAPAAGKRYVPLLELKRAAVEAGYPRLH